MANSRRRFLKSGTMVALCAGVPASFAERGLAKEPGPTTFDFTLMKSDFEACLHSNFWVHVRQAGTVDMTLASVTDLRRAAQNKISLESKEGFSLLFEAPPGTKLPQDTYLIEHGDLGKFRVLMVPMAGRKRRAPRYEVIINRLAP
jgi:hypothetical protein